MNDAELGQAIRELNACIDEAVHYINVGQECFIVSVGAFEIRFGLAKLGKRNERSQMTKPLITLPCTAQEEAM